MLRVGQDDLAMLNPVTKVVGEAADPELVLRQKWSESLVDHMKAQQPPMTSKALSHALADLGVDVSRQAIESWMKGYTSPRPHHQAALGTVFHVPVRSLFPIENLKVA